MTNISKISYENRFQLSLQAVQSALEQYLSGDKEEMLEAPKKLWEAMRYSTLDGGKRIRSVLAIETCLACGGDLSSILPAACAIELVHAQSLIHDDLPCMDDDELRRGKPTLHIAYNESTAVLAGDALLAMAFGIITKYTPRGKNVGAETILKVIDDFSDVTSVKGLVNGQYVDIHYEEKSFTPEVLEYIHTYKTGALFRFSTRTGARLAGAGDHVIETLTAFGDKIGLAFQIVDDLLDIQSTSETLGKTAGKDLTQQKATFPALYGLANSRLQALNLISEAKEQLRQLSLQLDNIPDITPGRNLTGSHLNHGSSLNINALLDLADYIHTRIS
ncbi:MAG: farnesyl diphosphate synthase [Vampirovibrionales bacterium]|nr:farnesyl diphosphate synthase [Vampirovibrionales bacterium]